MDKKFLDSVVNNALPYFVGGALLYWGTKRYFHRDDIDFIKHKAKVMSSTYFAMSLSEKKHYAKVQSDLIFDILFWRVASSLRDNTDIVEIIKSNEFCLVDIGAAFDESWVFRPLSLFLVNCMNSKDLIKIADEIALLREHDF